MIDILDDKKFGKSMIMAKQIINLSETYFDTKNVNGELLTIFVNPTVSEMLEASQYAKKQLGWNEIRFVADAKKQKVFVWDSGLAYHAKVRLSISYPEDFVKTPYLLNGVATVSGTEAIMTRIDNFVSVYNGAAYSGVKSERKRLYTYLDMLLNNSWMWLNKYIQCDKCLNDMKQDVSKIQKNW